ncbi:hypothetical protein F5Y16DRAFT_370476 [Xylariaceae sp. FL0255]|nr:hypothetical protein F5Y16DRAFT_370476 [Xylariaceae sp. FL0255]
MTRPHIIRADSIDLQDHDAPSAKDHHRVKPTSINTSNGSLAPHQAETIREVEEERAEEEARSPRVSWSNGDVERDLQQYAEDLASGVASSMNGSKMQQQDALAIAQNGGVSAADDDEADAETNADDDLDDDMMDRISSSPSIIDEDIDFEFVYALHTFVATVEGQANATKGDTMVLLDDSNSYWWLVRVVKDSSIGYLPAEHIETPTERLARLNKHRNVELSSTTLSDHEIKSKNPIKSAIRRRKAKTVTFTAPTYVNYEDPDFSDEEGEENGAQDEEAGAQQEEQQEQATSKQVNTEAVEEDETAKVEPLKPRSQKQVEEEKAQVEEADTTESSTPERDSEENADGKTERVTRNGTIRNTDSFFRDETIETKKITITPVLFRDDDESRTSSDAKDLRQRPSFEKELVADKKDDKRRKDKDKKEKEKKPSAIRNFFSRKDKKKSVDEDDESFGKRSMDVGAGFGDVDMVDEPEDMESPQKAPSRNPSKLTKAQPRTEPSPTRRSTRTPSDVDQFSRPIAEVKTNTVANVPPATLRMVESDQSEDQRWQAPKEDSKAKSTMTKILPTSSETRPPKVTKAKSRVELDEFDSSEDEKIISEPAKTSSEPKKPAEEKLIRPSIPGAFPDSYISTVSVDPAAGELHVEEAGSPYQVSPISPAHPPALVGDTSSQEERSSPVSSPSPDLGDVDDQTHRNQDSMTTSTSTTTTSTWNDASLRAFFDSGSEIRDLLVVVYDKTDVPPAGPDHPIAGSLFREQNAQLAEITTQLDNMLGDWLARKQRLRGTL